MPKHSVSAAVSSKKRPAQAAAVSFPGAQAVAASFPGAQAVAASFPGVQAAAASFPGAHAAAVSFPGAQAAAAAASQAQMMMPYGGLMGNPMIGFNPMAAFMQQQAMGMILPF